MFDSCLSQTPLNPILSGWASEKNINPDKIITKMAARTSGNCFVLLVLFFFSYFFQLQWPGFVTPITSAAPLLDPLNLDRNKINSFRVAANPR